MQLQGLWEYRDETKRPFQICALKTKGTQEKVTIDSQMKTSLNVWLYEYLHRLHSHNRLTELSTFDSDSMLVKISGGPKVRPCTWPLRFYTT